MTYQKRFCELLIGLALLLCILGYLAAGPFALPSAAAEAAAPIAAAAPSDKCVVCHTNVGVLQAMAVDDQVRSEAGENASLAGELPPLPPGEGALVHEEFLSYGAQRTGLHWLPRWGWGHHGSGCCPRGYETRSARGVGHCLRHVPSQRDGGFCHRLAPNARWLPHSPSATRG